MKARQTAAVVRRFVQPGSVRPGVLLAGLVACSSGLRFWAGSLVPSPWIAPDEFVYALLGRSLYHTGHFSILGGPVRFYTLVVPLIVGGPLSLGDRDTGYLLLKALQAIVMSLAAVPVYLWGRAFLGPGKAFVAAALTLAVPGLAYSGLIMTEAAFYPIAVLCAWALARALERPTAVRQGLALAAIVLAAATRLQALVLVPALVTAVALKALLDRDLRTLRRFVPLLGGLAALAAAWSGWQLRKGGPATDILGAYRAAGETSYNVGDAARFVLYHAGDLVLMSGIFPCCAAGLLTVGALRRREASEPARALLAVAVSFSLWFVLEVGIFASEHVGRLAERDLLSLLPLLFLVFALWFERGSPRPRLAAGLTALAAFLLVLRLPIGKLVSQAAIPDAFMLIPLWRLQVRSPNVSLELVVDVAAALAVVAFVLVPRRFSWTLAAALLAFFALTSLSVSRVVAAQATLVRQATLGDTRNWIDRAASGPTAYLYTGENYWNSAWQSLFWNHRVTAAYDLTVYRIPGPLPQPSVGPLEDGRLVLPNGRQVVTDYVVAAAGAVAFVGSRAARALQPSLTLWRIRPPLRISLWTQRPQYGVPGPPDPVIRVFACRPGAIHFRLQAFEAREVLLRRNGVLFRRVNLASGEIRHIVVPTVPPRPVGTRLCRLDVVTGGNVAIEQVRYQRG